MLESYVQNNRMMSVLSLGIPLTIIAGMLGTNAVIVFVLSLAALVPLAELIGAATKVLAKELGAQIGALVNIILGNFPEGIVTLIALHAGYTEVVLGSLAGGFVVNMLFVLGSAAIIGCRRNGEMSFSLERANTKTLILISLGIVALIIPILELFHPEFKTHVDQLDSMSLLQAFLLLAIYWVYINTTLQSAKGDDGEYHGETADWSRATTIVSLVIAAALVMIVSKYMVGSIEAVTETLPVSEQFIGFIVISIFANMAEYPVALSAAREGEMGLSVEISVGSPIQIIGLILPAVVFASFLFGNPLELVFPGVQLLAVAISILFGIMILRDAEVNQDEGWIGIILFAFIAGIFYIFT